MAQLKKEKLGGLILIIILLIGCQTAPELQTGESMESFARRDCFYRNAKNTSICSVEGEEYKKSMQENRTRARLEYCEKMIFKNMTKNECRLFLNQK